MNKILITGFEPFNKETINPSIEAVKQLPETIGHAQIITLELPTSYQRGADILIRNIETHKPDAVVCAGQAGGRSNISIERVAINICEASIADNDDVIHKNTPSAQNAPAAYFSTLPIYDIVDALHKHDIPAAISNSAGTFVCNHVMYQALHYIEKNHLSALAGFIHIPYIPQQTLGKTAPSMSLSLITESLIVVIKTLIKSV